MTPLGSHPVAELFEAHGQRLRDGARRVLGSEADADDVVQEVMLSVLDGPHLVGVERVFGWLWTVVRRRCVDLIRSRVRRQARETEVGVRELFAGSDDPEALMEQDETAQLVAEAVNALPEAQQWAFVANTLEGLTFREMAEQSGVPMGTLMARKKQAVDTIRARLTRAGLTP